MNERTSTRGVIQGFCILILLWVASCWNRSQPRRNGTVLAADLVESRPIGSAMCYSLDDKPCMEIKSQGVNGSIRSGPGTNFRVRVHFQVEWPHSESRRAFLRVSGNVQLLQRVPDSQQGLLAGTPSVLLLVHDHLDVSTDPNIGSDFHHVNAPTTLTAWVYHRINHKRPSKLHRQSDARASPVVDRAAHEGRRHTTTRGT